MNRKRSTVLIVLAIVIFMLAAPFIYVTVNRRAVPVVNLPIPNGFDTLTKAAETVQGLPTGDIEEMSVEALKSVLSENQETLRLIEKASDEAYVIRR